MCFVISTSETGATPFFGRLSHEQIRECDVARDLYCTIPMNFFFHCIFIRVKKVVGFDANDMVGQKVMDFFHPRDCGDPGHKICKKKCTVMCIMYFYVKNST